MRITFDVTDKLERLLKKLAKQCCKDECCSPTTRFQFFRVTDGNTWIKGEIKHMKKEFGFASTFEARPVGKPGATHEAGSENWSVQAQDSDGNDRSSDYSITVDPSNALKARIQHSGTVESTALLTLRADGDPDADEVAEVVGTVDIVVDAPNVTAFEIVEVAEAPPVEGGEGGGGEGGGTDINA